MSENLFSIKIASEATGASKQVIRSYTQTYARWFSTEATPEHGRERRFTAADLKLIAFIYQNVIGQALNHNQVQERLVAGALNDFEWDVPIEAHGAPVEPPGDTGTMLVPFAQLQAARLLLEDAQRREQEAVARAEEQDRQLREQAQQRERELQEQINQLLRDLGHKEGELAALRASKPKGFWARLFGGGE